MLEGLGTDHRRAILLLSVAAGASSASMRVCDPMLIELGEAFSTTPAEVAHAVSLFAVAYGSVQAFFGPLGDRVGKFRLIAYATLACMVGTLGAAFAASLDQLLAARVVTGLAAGGIIPLSMAWIGDTVPYEQRQATLARYLGGQVIGLIGGQFVGGASAHFFGWRSAFVVVLAVYLVVGLLLLRELGRNEVARRRPPPSEVASGLVGQIGAVLATPWARVILITVFLEGAAIFGGLAFAPVYLRLGFGLDLVSAGAAMGLFGAGGFTYILVSSRVVPRLGEPGLAVVGGLALAVAWGAVVLAPAWGWVLPGIYVAGFGFYMLHNTLQANATQMAPQVRGTAVSLFASCFFLGQSAGVALGALLVTRTGYAPIFAAASIGAGVIGSVLSMLLRRRGVVRPVP